MTVFIQDGVVAVRVESIQDLETLRRFMPNNFLGYMTEKDWNAFASNDAFQHSMGGDLLFRYSEWLDGQGLVLNDVNGNDSRTHEDLVRAFLNERYNVRASTQTDPNAAERLQKIEEATKALRGHMLGIVHQVSFTDENNVGLAMFSRVSHNSAWAAINRVTEALGEEWPYNPSADRNLSEATTVEAKAVEAPTVEAPALDAQGREMC